MRALLLALLFLIPLQANDCSCDAPCIDWEFTLSPVLWQVHEEGFEYATGKQIDQDWAFGVRLNLAYNTHCFGILALDWTYFRTTEKSMFKHGTSIWSESEAIYEKMRADTAIAFNLFDLRIGMLYCPTRCLELMPYAALSGIWLDQKFIIHGKNDSITLDKVAMDGEYWGLGPKLGLNTLWSICRGWSIYGNIASAFFFGNQSLRQKEKTRYVSNDTTLFSLVDTEGAFRVYLNLGAGLSWEWIFPSCDYSIGFAAGWEALFFFGQYPFRHPPSYHHKTKDLFVQGLTLSGTFGF